MLTQIFELITLWNKTRPLRAISFHGKLDWKKRKNESKCLLLNKGPLYNVTLNELDSSRFFAAFDSEPYELPWKIELEEKDHRVKMLLRNNGPL